MKRTLILTMAALLLTTVDLDAQYLDSYGGTTVKHFDDGQGNGFFRAKHDGEQWWLVTPENNAYLSFGLNHFHSNLWAKDYNKSHWEEEFGGSAWSGNWKESFYSHAQEITSLAGTNSLGYHNEDAILKERPKFLPYFRQYRPIKFSLHENPSEEDFVDIFADDFATTCATVAQAEVAPFKDDPMIIGFVMSDVPIFTETYAYSASKWKGYTIPTWARVLRNLPGTAPGKQKYVECMQTEYSVDINAFNTTYGTSFADWDALKNAEDWRADADKNNSRETKDNNAFNSICISKYYEVASEAFRAVNPNHMFIGDKINANLNDLSELDVMVNAIEDYVDVIMFQCFAKPDFQQQVQDRIAAASDLPYMNGDGGFGADGDPHMPNPQYPTAESQEQRAGWILEYASGAFKDPNFVGYHLCGVIDGWNTSGTNKPGIENALGDPHDVTFQALNEIGENLYQYRGLSSEPFSNVPDNLSDWGKYEDIKAEALERIDHYRKGDANLQVLLPGDRPAANASLRVRLKRHDFLWGAVIRDIFFTSPYSDTYKKYFLKYFNATGFAIELKPRWRDTNPEKTAYEMGMPWINANNIYMRGHALTWEGYKYLRNEDRAIYDNENLSDREKGDSLVWSLGRHFHHALPKWDVGCWDVTNESMSNNDVNDLLPDYNTHAHWFRLADSIRRTCGREDVVLYANDYQVISAITPWALNYTKEGYSAVGRPALYRELLDEQMAAGAPIEAIGFQSRLKQGMITPDSIYKRLLDFERYNMPYQATEFEIRDHDKYTYTDKERRILTEYMMIMYLSHKNVQGFWHWTFFDQNNQKLDYPLFNYDGTPTINGIIWMDLMDGIFTTDVSLQAGNEGEGQLRGYFGTYDLSAVLGDSIFFGNFRIDSTLSEPVTTVNMDRGFRLEGLESGGIYPLGMEMGISLEAFSLQGDIDSTGIYLNDELIGHVYGPGLDMNYTPGTEREGWNTITLKAVDEAGNDLSYTFKVYFGEALPRIEVLEQPEDTIVEGSTGNQISFDVVSKYSALDSVIVSYAGKTYIQKGETGPFVYSLDGLTDADYDLSIRVTDEEGGQAEHNIPFTVITDANKLPEIEITAPDDGSVFQPGKEISFSVQASDEDGSIVLLEVFLNSSLIISVGAGEHNFTLDTLSSGVYEIAASAKDDRGDYAHDTITIEVEKEVSAHAPAAGTGDLYIYPNPVSDDLYFSKPCDFRLYSLQGQLLMEGRNTTCLDLSNYQPGMYLVRTDEQSFLFGKK